MRSLLDRWNIWPKLNYRTKGLHERPISSFDVVANYTLQRPSCTKQCREFLASLKRLAGSSGSKWTLLLHSENVSSILKRPKGHWQEETCGFSPFGAPLTGISSTQKGLLLRKKIPDRRKVPTPTAPRIFEHPRNTSRNTFQSAWWIRLEFTKSGTFSGVFGSGLCLPFNCVHNNSLNDSSRHEDGEAAADACTHGDPCQVVQELEKEIADEGERSKPRISSGSLQIYSRWLMSRLGAFVSFLINLPPTPQVW